VKRVPHKLLLVVGVSLKQADIGSRGFFVEDRTLIGSKLYVSMELVSGIERSWKRDTRSHG
jgi:hypothetical protein